MHGFVPPDPESDVSTVKIALVYAPRMKRHRFSANCITVLESEQQALSLQNVKGDLHAAKVLGPSKSSEGQYIYYLVEWLFDTKR